MEKEDIEANPFIIIISAQKHYSKPGLYLEIELLEKEEVLCLFHGNMGSGLGLIRGPRPIKISSWHCFDNEGKKFFYEHKTQFGKVWIMIPGEKSPTEFSSLKSFLSEITED